MINSRFVSGILGTLATRGILVLVLHQATRPTTMNEKMSSSSYIEVIASIPVLQSHSAACPFVVDHEWGWGANVSEQMLHSRCWEPV
jgi:hypothetical protein